MITATIIISIVALGASCLSAFFAVHGARVRRETAQLRAERLRLATERQSR